MHFIGYGLTNPGRRRPRNEDFVVVNPELGLYVVCDGMGGHSAGDVASRAAAETLIQHLRAHSGEIRGFRDQRGQRERLMEVLRAGVDEASRVVHKLANSAAGRAGMGTTCTALWTLRGVGIMAHVGDSRLYLWRNDRLHQLSNDHTYAAELLRKGGTTFESVKDWNAGKALSRAVGLQSTVQVDSLVFDVLPGDTYMLCSDGLSCYLEEAELGPYLADPRAEAIANRLIDVANSRGGRDNVSVIVVRASLNEDEEPRAHARSERISRQLQSLSHVYLFHHLSMRELVALMERFHPVKVPRGEAIVCEGEPGGCLYIIVDGKVAVTRAGKELARLSSGSHFGEMSLLNERPRSATVTALSRTDLLKIERPAFNDLIRGESRMAVKLLWTFAQVLSLRLNEATELYAIDPKITPEPPPNWSRDR